jgi:hypothetical protein
MRTTIRLDDDLLGEAKQLAARRGTTFTALVEDALRELLARPPAQATRDPADLPVFTGGSGFQPGVDLDDSAALLELMEEGLPLHKRR